jgi:hypothetical protein
VCFGDVLGFTLVRGSRSGARFLGPNLGNAAPRSPRFLVSYINFPLKMVELWLQLL